MFALNVMAMIRPRLSCRLNETSRQQDGEAARHGRDQRSREENNHRRLEQLARRKAAHQERRNRDQNP